MPRPSQRGAASVEHAGLALLVALLALTAIASVASGPLDGGRELGAAIARKIRCAPRLPGPCWRDPLTEAYGRPLGGLVRALAPAPTPLSGLMAVDFRYCRSASCAAPGSGPRLTASNRRTTAFVSVTDERPAGGAITVTYWLYRPSWDRLVTQSPRTDVPLTGPPTRSAVRRRMRGTEPRLNS